MRDRASQINVTEPFTTHLARDNLDTALLTDNAAMLHALVLAAVTLVILGRAKDLGTEKAVALGFEGPVVYRFRFLNLTERAFTDLFRRSDRETDRVEIQRVFRSLKQAVYIFQDTSSFSG